MHDVETQAITVALNEARWVSVTLRVPPQTAASTAPGVHEIHVNFEREAQDSDAARTLREKSTYVLPR